MSIKPEIVKDLKLFDWKFITAYGCSLDQLNSKQFRFLKGFVCEELIAHEDPTLVCVREDHRDYNWTKHDVSVELKSQLSMSMYRKNGELRENFIVKFTNSNGTNKKDMLDSSEICDLTLVVRNDGTFVVDKETVLKNLTKTGDGFDLKLNKKDITEISGYIKVDTKYDIDLEIALVKAVRDSINRYKNV